MGQGFISKYILRDIAGFIRKRKGTTEEIKPVDMAAELESIPTFEDGKQAEYDRFWDAYQENGKRTDYRFAFSGLGWTAETLKPKYDIIPKSVQLMFRAMQIPVNISDFFESQGVVLDFSKTTSFAEMVLDSNIIGFGTVDTRAASNINYAFSTAKNLQTIRLLILKDDGSQLVTAAFNNCPALVDITFEGVIGKSGLNLQWSTKLSKASIESIVGCLSTTTSGLSITLSKTAVNAAFTTEEWTALEQTRPNWTISLV